MTHRALSCLAATVLVLTSATARAQDDDLASVLRVARTQLAEGNAEQAVRALRPLAESGDGGGAAWLWLGRALYAQGALDEALEASFTASEDEAIRAEALYDVARAFAGMEDEEGALDALKQAIAAGFADALRLAEDSSFAGLRTKHRLTGLLPPYLRGTDSFVEPTRVLHEWFGEAPNSEFGWVARRVGDVDGDGVVDFVTTAPSFQGNTGKVFVISSRSGEVLFTRLGEPGERIGNGASAAGDVNADGVPDVIVGAPAGGPGHAYVLSGKDGALLHRLEGEEPGDQFGYKVCGLGDIDGDGHADVAVSALAGHGASESGERVEKAGACFGFSGKTGERLFALRGREAGGKFGSAANGSMVEGQLLLGVGAQDEGPGRRGRVHVYELAGGSARERFTIESDEGNATLGMMFISFPGDLNGDGIEDVYASDFNDHTKGRGAGRVLVVSGADGTKLLELFGTQAGEGFGTSVSDAGDLNGDGIGDLAVGAWQNAEGAKGGGKIYLHDGSDGHLLGTWTSRQPGETLGFDSTGIGDVDGDGIADLLLTSGWSPARGPKTGRVLIVAGREP